MRVAAAQIEIEEGEDNGGWRYEGQMQRGERHGQGVCSEAEVRGRDICNGHGTLTYLDGSVHSGQWKDHEFLG